MINEHIAEVCIEFVKEEDILDSSNKNTHNIICGVMCNKGEILGSEIKTGTVVPVNYFSAYSIIRKLAEFINEI